MSTAAHDDDPISAASSGLLAIGVAPRRRMETLGLLAALLDLADEQGEVLLDGALMATEERLGIDLCLEGYEWLEQLGVIERTWSGWVIPNSASHGGPIGATVDSLAVLGRHLEYRDAVAAVTAVQPPAPVEVPVSTRITWRRRVPAVAASVAAGIAVLAGASQLMPQAAVTTRNAAVGTNATAGTGAVGTVTSAATSATDGPAVAAVTELTQPGVDAVTTTTSTTLLPSIPCLSDTINGLTTRSGLTKQSAPLPPGVLPCP